MCGLLFWVLFLCFNIQVMVRVVIPSHTQGRSKSGQPFTMYSVEVYSNGRSHFVDRRYRDFHELHCELKKSLDTSSLPDFPPKKLRNLSPRVIEERRLLLEKYLQSVLSNSMIHPSLQTFLGLSSDSIIGMKSLTDSVQDVEQETFQEELNHQPVIGFASEDQSRCETDVSRVTTTAASDKDLLVSNRDSILPDIVLKGALDAIYCRFHED